MPLRSEEADAAVGDVFATVLVLVSDMWILLTGIPKIREAIPVSFWYADLGPFLFRHELGELIRLYKHERAHQPDS